MVPAVTVVCRVFDDRWGDPDWDPQVGDTVDKILFTANTAANYIWVTSTSSLVALALVTVAFKVDAVVRK